MLILKPWALETLAALEITSTAQLLGWTRSELRERSPATGRTLGDNWLNKLEARLAVHGLKLKSPSTLGTLPLDKGTWRKLREGLVAAGVTDPGSLAVAKFIEDFNSEDVAVLDKVGKQTLRKLRAVLEAAGCPLRDPPPEPTYTADPRCRKVTDLFKARVDARGRGWKLSWSFTPKGRGPSPDHQRVDKILKVFPFAEAGETDAEWRLLRAAIDAYLDEVISGKAWKAVKGPSLFVFTYGDEPTGYRNMVAAKGKGRGSGRPHYAICGSETDPSIEVIGSTPATAEEMKAFAAEYGHDYDYE